MGALRAATHDVAGTRKWPRGAGSARWCRRPRPRRRSTWTRCSTTRAPASSSAAARAASARPPPRRRWRSERPSGAARSSSSPSTRRGGWPSRWGSRRSTTLPGRWPAPRRSPAGSLDAMMLDMKRTFDEVVESQATPEKAKQILENPFYIALSSSFAGTQEYMAMEKLGQLQRDAHRDGTYDLIVVDTPPSRSALDFLDAPERLSSLPRRPVRPAAARPGARPGPDHDGGLRHRDQRAVADPRRRSSSPTCRPSSPPWTRSSVGSASAPSRPTRCSRPPVRRSSSSPRPSRTRCARRRTSSSGSARTGCRWPAWSSTAPAPPRSARSPPTRR